MKKYYLVILTIATLCSCGLSNTESKADKAVVSKVIETPAEAIEALKEGNKRFFEGHSSHGHSDLSYVKTLDVDGQKPFATVIACSDSRVPVEILFDQGFGDIFVIRTAGNSLIDNVTLGSVDYAINHLKSKVVVVLGHTNCGAITSIVNMGDEHAHAVENDSEVQELLENIAAYIPQHKGSHKELDQAILDNVEVQKEQVLDREHIKKLIGDKTLDVVGAIYHLDSGVVEFL